MKPCPCLSPVRVYNDTLGTYQYVPCGHCEACIASKGFRLTDVLGETIARYTNKYFVTLTFSDEFLPVAKYDDVSKSYLHPFDADYNGVCYSVEPLLVEKSLANDDFKASFSKYGGVPVLSRRLAILFKKRLRKLFAKYYGKEYLFIYLVGEYGPTTLRPHYHCVLCTNAKCRYDIFKDCVYKAWSVFDKVKQEYICQYGKIDFQTIISKGVRSYVAQYLNCTTNLPPIYKSGRFRPFYQTSPLISTNELRFCASDKQRLFFSCRPEKTCISFIDHEDTVDVLPLGIINRVFPKCFKFAKLSYCDRVQLYGLFRYFKSFTATEFARLVIDAFVGVDASLPSFIKCLLVDDDRQASYLRLVKAFYISRRVCLNAISFGVSLDDYVRQIDLFWSRYELLKLRKFYELQLDLLEDPLNPTPLELLFSLYYNTEDNIKSLDLYLRQFKVNSYVRTNHIAAQSSYACLCKKIVLDSTKTKKRNSYFESKGYVRRNFMLHLKTKKSCRTFFQI